MRTIGPALAIEVPKDRSEGDADMCASTTTHQWKAASRRRHQMSPLERTRPAIGSTIAPRCFRDSTGAFRRRAIAALSLYCAMAAQGQLNSDELLAKGAVRLTASELKEALTGAEISGPTAMGFALNWTLRPDGALAGTASYSSTPITGRWRVTEQGEFCFDHVSSMGRDAGCWNWFRLDSQYFAVRDGVVMKRSVVK